MSESRYAIPHSRPTVGRDDLRFLAPVIETSHLGGGAEVERFESELARTVGVPDAVAVNSGSAALHLALLALGVKRGDRVVLPAYCCAAVMNAVNYTGAEPVLADVLDRDGNIDPDSVRKRLNRRVKAVIVPHMFGMPAEVRSIRSFGVPVVEDCAMGIGGSIGKTMLGAWGDVSVFSFYATKVMSTGTGGAVLTHRSDLVRRIRDLVDYDNRDDYKMRYNYRMNAVMAALGRAQLKKLPHFLKRRRRIAEVYYRSLPFSGDQLPPRREGRIYYRFVVEMGGPADPWIRHMKTNGIECKRPVYRPLHRYFPGLKDSCPVADRFHRNSLSLPIYPTLTEAEARKVSRALERYHE